MQNSQIKTHTDGIWISMAKEIDIISKFSQAIQKNNFDIVRQDDNNYRLPYVYQRNGQVLDCRFVDSVFLEHPESWTQSKFVI